MFGKESLKFDSSICKHFLNEFFLYKLTKAMLLAAQTSLWFYTPIIAKINLWNIIIFPISYTQQSNSFSKSILNFPQKEIQISRVTDKKLYSQIINICLGLSSTTPAQCRKKASSVSYLVTLQLISLVIYSKSYKNEYEYPILSFVDLTSTE